VRYFTIVVATVCLAGCGSSGITSTGYPDEFFINLMVAPAMGGGAAAQRIAIDQAIDFCRDHQRVFGFDHSHPGGDLRYPPTGTSLTFRCVLPGTPVWQRPKDLTDWPAADR